MQLGNLTFYRYTQNKYNLLREESEGFSKVLCLLHTGMNNEQVDASRKDLLALIGMYLCIFFIIYPFKLTLCRLLRFGP
jgi:hypothetical protein